jgi:hypothetical protein
VAFLPRGAPRMTALALILIVWFAVIPVYVWIKWAR